MTFKYIVDNISNEIEDDFNNLVNNDDKTPEEPKNDIIIGIDLGTTNSAVSIIRNNNYEIIPDEYGNRTIPSFVSYTNVNKYIGVDGKNNLELCPENTFYEVKRLIGRKFSEEIIQNELEFLSYEVIGDVEDRILLKPKNIKNKELISPEEISSLVLRKLKNMAENYLKCPIKKAVITVPAYFNDTQREATRDSATIAGLECVRIINEPTSAALMYGLHNRTKNSEEDTVVLVYDLGGGTLDCSVLRISDGIFEVLASTGNTHLGGSDFDSALMKYCLEWFKKKYKINSLTDVPNLSICKLKKACERAKKILSTQDNTIIAVKDFYQNKNIYIKLSRKLFQSICKEILLLCLKPVERVLESSNLKREEIDEVILVGGATRMREIRDNLSLFFRGKKLNMSVDPDEVVSAGAAIQGYIIANSDDPFSDSVVLLDILPLSLGVETIGGEMTNIIPRNSKIPCKRTKRFTTDSDYETEVTIKIYEGERKLTKDNFRIAEFNLENIEPAPRGVAQINVSFEIDVNGIVYVTAEDVKNNDNKKTIMVKCNKGRLTNNQINLLLKEAEENDMKDKYNRIIKRLRYEIDDLCSNILANLNNNNFKLKDDDKLNIKEDVNKIIDWLKIKLTEQYPDRKEYESVAKKLKKRYGTLILKFKNNQENLKSLNKNKVESTSVFQEDKEEEEEKQVFQELEEEEFGFEDEDDENERQNIKDKRNLLIDLCNSVFDIISSSSFKISKDKFEDIKDFIDDTLLWAHIKQKIKLIEYDEKIAEINKKCDELVDTIDNNKPISKKEELEHLCYVMKTTFNNNLTNFSKEFTELNNCKNNINNIIDNILDKLIEEKVSDDFCNEQIQIINEHSNNLYYLMNKFNLTLSTDDKQDYEITQTSGKSIAELLKEQNN